MKITSKIYYALFKHNKNFKLRKSGKGIEEGIEVIIQSPNNNLHYVYVYFLNYKNIFIPTPVPLNLEDFPGIDIFINLIKKIHEKIK